VGKRRFIDNSQHHSLDLHYVLHPPPHTPGGGHAARSLPLALRAAFPPCDSRASLQSDPSIQHRERCSNTYKERRHSTHATQQPDRAARNDVDGRRSRSRRISEWSEGTGTVIEAVEAAVAPAVGFVVDRGYAVPDLLGTSSSGGAVIGDALYPPVLPAAVALFVIGLVGVAAGFLLGDLDVIRPREKLSGTRGPGEQLPSARVPAAPCVDL
jgi:hypothetical protein